jgi:CRISPR-associated protein Cas5d
MPSHHDWRGLEVPESFRYPPMAVEVGGTYACFTRPEFTSERLSYAVMTPPAAVGLLSSVFWKPQFRWVVDRIDVLNPVRWTTLRRNEAGTAITADHRHDGYLDVDTVVQQRMTSMLRDVRYRIHAHVWVHPGAEEQDPAKWRDQFLRRVKRGQSFRTPFLGMREFHADVFPAGEHAPIDWSEDLGIMLHSIGYDEGTGKESYDWFEARADHGTVHVPRQGLIAAHNAEVSP